MVPPDTPGMTFAAPMAAPFSAVPTKRVTLIGFPPTGAVNGMESVGSSGLPSAIKTGNSMGDGGERFPRNSAGPFGELIGRDGLAPLRSN